MREFWLCPRSGGERSLWTATKQCCEQNTNRISKAMATYDVRAIANFVLDYAAARGVGVTNLALNKIIFFLHVSYLIKFDRPLVSAKIEAWEYGPVFREIYRTFKAYREKPIESRAQRINPDSGVSEICKADLSNEETVFVETEVEKLIRFSASTLVSMSHVSGGPWDSVWNHDTVSNASMKISDEVIRSWYKTAARH